jgi:dTDP-4-amino-4,6-dideoxygalactose transaminase
MKVPYFDLSQQTAALRPQIDEAIKRVIDSGRFISGAEVEAFENEYARYIGVDHAVAVNSGTAALHLALLGVGVCPGDRVITTPATFVATAEAIAHCGAIPVFVDIDPETMNLDPYLVEQAYAKNASVRALLPVHLYGQPASMDKLSAVADKLGLQTVWDACQAHGATFRGTKIGKQGRACAFSFYPGKNLGAFGEGGIITTNSAQLATESRMRRAHGSRELYNHEVVGFNYRLDEIQAAILRVKLPHLDRWVNRRRQIAALYREAFLGRAGLELQLPHPLSNGAYHLFVVRHTRREQFQAHLESCGVGHACHYPRPSHHQRAFSASVSLPHALQWSRECVSLPIWPEMTDDQVQHVIESVLSFSY